MTSGAIRPHGPVVIDIEMPVEWNLKRIAKAEGLHPRDLTVIILNRDRNRDIIDQVRDVGSMISLIAGGDVAAAIAAANPEMTGKHVLMGSGGATEGVLVVQHLVQHEAALQIAVERACHLRPEPKEIAPASLRRLATESA